MRIDSELSIFEYDGKSFWLHLILSANVVDYWNSSSNIYAGATIESMIGSLSGILFSAFLFCSSDAL